METILTPDLGNTAEAEIIEVNIKIGDTVGVDDTLIVIESDKATMEVPAPTAGTIQKIHVKVGDNIATDSPIADIEPASVKEGETKKSETKIAYPSPEIESNHEVFNDIAEEKNKPTDSSTIKTIEKTTIGIEKPTHVESHEATNDTTIHAGPAVRKLARELGINLSSVTGSGPKERILKDDLQEHIKTQLEKKSQVTTAFQLPEIPEIDFTQFGETETRGLTKIQKITAKNLHGSWLNIPHVTQFTEADVTDLEAFRKQQPQREIKLTLLPFIIKAVSHALADFPILNSSLSSDSNNLIVKKYCHIGVAVDTDDGLVVPVIRNVREKSIWEITELLTQLSQQARAKRLTPDQMQGASFTVSSLGHLSGTNFSPIINPPEVAILGVSRFQVKPVFVNENFVPRKILPLSLSYDHRVINGVLGAKFCAQLVNYLTDIRQLLM